MGWKEKLIHYQDSERIPDEDLLNEAIASCESLFGTMEDKQLHENSRVLVLSYLALLNETNK